MIELKSSQKSSPYNYYRISEAEYQTNEKKVTTVLEKISFILLKQIFF